MNIKLLLGPMRLPFLILAPACALLGIGTAEWEAGHVEVFQVILVFIGAIAAHISVNAFNEYYDFKSGVDSRTHRTPFSGGSGTLQQHPELSRMALVTAVVALGITALIGVYFLFERGWGLLPLGLLGLFIIYAYTTWMVYNPILCLIAPGLGFGTFIVLGAHFALTGAYSWTAFFASLVPFFLVSDLLLLNQFPDAEADQSVGRNHLPIRIGKRKSSYIYGVFLLGAYLAIGLGVILDKLPGAALLGLGTLILAVPAFMGALRHAEDTGKLIPAMSMNVLVNILTPVLTAIGLFLS